MRAGSGAKLGSIFEGVLKLGPHLRLLALGYLADDGEYQVPAVLRVMAQAYGAERYLDRDLLVRFQASLGEQIIWRAATTG